MLPAILSGLVAVMSLALMFWLGWPWLALVSVIAAVICVVWLDEWKRKRMLNSTWLQMYGLMSWDQAMKIAGYGWWECRRLRRQQMPTRRP